MFTAGPFLPPANVVCEGYVFTPVCDSVNRGGGACVVAPGGGVCGCSGGRGHAWLLPGGCEWLLRGGGEHAWDTTRYADTVNERAVRILLECILV